MTFEILQLARGKEKAIRRKHPWVFSGTFKNIPGHIEDGAVVEIQDFKGTFLGIGLFRRGSITVSLLSFEPIHSMENLIETKIAAALSYRKSLGILDDKSTNCCRLVFAEGDGLSGLIIDKYADTAVIQIHHPGWKNYQKLIADLLLQTSLVSHVYSKPADKITVDEDQKGTLAGELTNTLVLENGHQFIVDWEDGQKTGFFLDQRENRKKLSAYCKGRSVLNTFSYTGGFSVYALAAGAIKAISVDSSQAAIDLANHNASVNDLDKNHEGIASDVFEYFKTSKDDFDIIILDPPAFSKNRRSTHNAVQAYKRLNLAGLRKVNSGGYIFTFSCSQHVDFKLFEDTVRAAAIESQRQIRIVERLTQPADHPVNLYHPEGEYLKGLILQVT